MADQPAFEPVFIAARVAEAELLERFLDEQDIEFEMTPEAFVRMPMGTCAQGLLFRVPAGQADHVRRMLSERGLERGIVESEEER